MHDNQHNLFETPIWGFKFAHHDLQTIDYTNHILELYENEVSASKSNIGGWQSRDNIHEDGIFQEFNKDLLLVSSDILKDYTTSKPYIMNMWANVNKKHAYNGHHTHQGELSGVFYCSAIKEHGQLIFVDPRIRSFQSVIRSNSFAVKPERLALIIFPSWLEHYVRPNITDIDRISISFNIGIK